MMRRQLVLLIAGLVSILFVARVLDSYAVATSFDAPAITTLSATLQATDAIVIASNVMTPTALPVEMPVAVAEAIATEPVATVTPTETVEPAPVDDGLDMPPTPLKAPRTSAPATRAPATRTSVPTTPTPVPSPTPDLPPLYTVNGLPIETFVVMPDPVRQHVREIYAQGQSVGRNPRAFSRLGDSTILWPRLLAVFDTQKFKLGGYAYLQPSVDFFAGSFSRDGLATRKAFHSWSAFDPMWADKSVCRPNEAPLSCEFRLNNPSIVLIRLGVNDSGSVKMFDEDLRKIITYCVESGVIPVIGTKPDRFEGQDNVINDRMRKIAAEFNVPLWDYDLVAGTVPGRGLDKDNVHMYPASSHDYTLPQTFESGDAMHSLTALMMLDAIRTETQQPNDPRPRDLN
jgi:hypothetical protein